MTTIAHPIFLNASWTVFAVSTASYNLILSRSVLGVDGLHDESLVDVGNNTTTCNSGFDERVKFLVSSDS